MQNRSLWDPRYRGLLDELFGLDELAENPESVFAVDHEGRLVFLNPGWDRFARENGGHPQMAEAWGIGADYFSAISMPLRGFYRNLLERAPVRGETLTPRSHVYECSTASLFRQFHMQVYALPRNRGWLILNSLILERPHDRASHPVHPPDSERYRDAQGMIRQCSHCRRIHDPSDAARWNWVPAWVQRAPANTSHGLCPVCDRYYYPEDPEPSRGA